MGGCQLSGEIGCTEAGDCAAYLGQCITRDLLGLGQFALGPLRVALEQFA